jgi:TRAP-type mannitol/chloroaromatic compound transport system permease large subunit
MEVAVLTPPVGLNLYVLQGLAPQQVSIGDVVVGCLPFIVALCTLIGLLLLFPQLALWLPSAMR